MALQVSSVPLSETIISGLPLSATIASSARATRGPGSEVSTSAASPSRVSWSSTLNTRKRRPVSSTSETKSSTQIWFGRCARCSGARVPQALPRYKAGRPSSGSCTAPCVWPSPADADNRTGVVRPPARATVHDPPCRPCASCGTAPPTDQPPEASWRAAATVRDARQRCEPPHAAPEASEVFSDQVLERRIVQHLLGQQLLQPPILVLQSLKPAGL